MYLCEKYNIQWWLPVHVGSTVTRFLLEKIGFIPHRGQHPIDPGIDYDIIVNVRNPYTLAVSMWKNNLSKLDGMSFSDFIRTYKGEYPFYHNLSEIDYVEHSKDRMDKLKKIVHQETLYEDLISLDFIWDNRDLIKEDLNRIETVKTFKRNEYFHHLPLSEIYTDELADIVYTHRKKFFDFGGYDSESWKHLIY